MITDDTDSRKRSRIDDDWLPMVEETIVSRYASQIDGDFVPVTGPCGERVYAKISRFGKDDLVKKLHSSAYSNGHFLLTELLMDKMLDTAAGKGIQGRIVNVSSVVHGWVKREHFYFNQMVQPKKYNSTRAYAQSKLANILHAKEMARQLKARKANVTANAVHPGIVKTGIIRDHKGCFTDSLFFWPPSVKVDITGSETRRTARESALMP